MQNNRKLRRLRVVISGMSKYSLNVRYHFHLDGSCSIAMASSTARGPAVRVLLHIVDAAAGLGVHVRHT